MPMLLLLAVGAAGLLAFASSSKASDAKAPPHPPSPTPYALDAHLPPALRAQVDAALARDADPARLEAFASQLAPHYPYAAWHLRARAAGLRSLGYGAPRALPAPGALEANLPPDVRFNVTELLTQGTDPAMLEGVAAQLAATYPAAAAALRQRAMQLRAHARGALDFDANLPDHLRFNVVELLTHGTDPAMLETSASQLAAYPLAASALRLRAAYLRSVAAQRAGAPALPGQAPMPGGFDPGMPPQIAMQVASALMTETNPAKLRALADAVQAMYPTAAAMLVGKANTLDLGRAAHAAASGPAAAPPPSHLPAAPAATAPPAAWPARQEPAASSSPPLSTSPPMPVVLPPGAVPVPNNATLPPVSTTPPGMPPPGSPLRLPDGWNLPMPEMPMPSEPAKPAPMPGTFLDANMTADDNARVVQALSSESDPEKLKQLADANAAKYPNAALLLSNKAAAINALTLVNAPKPNAPAMPAPAMPATLPPVPPARARTYRVQQGDFPIRIAKKFGRPEAGWRELVDANPHKPRTADGNFRQLLPGEDLHLPASWPDLPGAAPPAPPPTIAPAAAPPAAPNAAQALDPTIPSDVAKAVMNALATETDAAKLRGFASSIMATYPVAAGVLLAKANTIGFLPPGASSGHTGLPVLHPRTAPGGVPVLSAAPSVPAPGPTVTASKYTVLKGDSPSRIAKKLTGNDRRWPELVAANPSKPKAPDGNFKNLQPGEVLTLPASWSASNTNGMKPSVAV